jgi:hypothetical protein
MNDLPSNLIIEKKIRKPKLHQDEILLISECLDSYDFVGLKSTLRSILRNHDIPIKELTILGGINRENFYNMLTTKTAMKVDILNQILNFFGLNLSISDKI